MQIGYYFSAFTVDKPWMGRVRLQSMVSALGPCNRCYMCACVLTPRPMCLLSESDHWCDASACVHAGFLHGVRPVPLLCAAAYDQLVKHALHWFQVNFYPTSAFLCMEPLHICYA